MASTSEHTNDNINRKEGGGEESETKNLPTSSNDNEQNDQSNEKIDDLNHLNKTDSLSAMQSSNENNTPDQTSSGSDISKEKINEQQQSVVTTTTSQQMEESDSTTVLCTSTAGASHSNKNTEDDSKNDQLAASSSSSLIHSDDTDKNEDKQTDKDKAFAIEKGDEQHLTDFQRRKAKYFFNVNLDIENKEYVTWEDVEFYLLFHLTTAGKEGADGGDLEARLSRTARAFWEHVHDQIPLPDGKRDQLTLNQFLDTWASLIDYVVRTNQLPSLVQDLVHLGFELYSTESMDGKSRSIQVQAFDQLFQKMNLGRPFAIMAYKYLTDNGTKPLDSEKIDSIVKAVITSSDDEHESHFLLPGFFKTISSKQDINENKKEEKANDQAQSSNNPSSPQVQPKLNENKTSTRSEEQPTTSSSSTATNRKPSNTTSQNEVNQSSSANPSTNQQQQNVSETVPSMSPQGLIQQEDENIRRLLRYYRIDDGDFIEVAGGSPQRLVLVHPERPLPAYIQQNKELLNKLQPNAIDLSSTPQNGFTKDYQSTPDSKPKITLEQRVFRGEAQKGPTIPLRQDQKQGTLSSTGVRQVYPQLNAAQQEEQRRQAKLQATQPVKDDNQATDDKSTANQPSLSSKQDESKPTKEISREEEEKIVASILKKLEPIVEKRVAAELRRLQSDDTDQDEDDHIIPFPFMLGGGFPFFAAPRGGPPPSQVSQEQQNASNQNQQQGNATRIDFGGLPPGAELFPPQILMAMMNDLAQAGGIEGEIPLNMPRPPQGPMGVEGFMMFVDEGQFMGGAPRPGPRF